MDWQAANRGSVDLSPLGSPEGPEISSSRYAEHTVVKLQRGSDKQADRNKKTGKDREKKERKTRIKEQRAWARKRKRNELYASAGATSSARGMSGEEKERTCKSIYTTKNQGPALRRRECCKSCRDSGRIQTRGIAETGALSPTRHWHVTESMHICAFRYKWGPWQL